MPTFLALVGMLISVMLIGVILLQRGRGGGLVGALSGLGGQSAFGTKAGDMFTRITIAIAAVWVLLAGIHGQVLRARTEKFKNEPMEIGSPSKDKGTASGAGDKAGSKSGADVDLPVDEPENAATAKSSKSTSSKRSNSNEDSSKRNSDKPANGDTDAKPSDTSESKNPPEKERTKATAEGTGSKGGEANNGETDSQK